MPPDSLRRSARQVLAAALALGWTADSALAVRMPAPLAFPVAVDSLAPSPGPFPEVPLSVEPRTGHAWAYASLGAGAVLVGSSFLLSDRADDTYEAYLAETDRNRIERLYDRTALFDRLATGSLLAGEALMAFGLYLRFLKPPLPPRVGLAVEPGRCAVSCRF